MTPEHQLGQHVQGGRRGVTSREELAVEVQRSAARLGQAIDRWLETNEDDDRDAYIQAHIEHRAVAESYREAVQMDPIPSVEVRS